MKIFRNLGLTLILFFATLSAQAQTSNEKTVQIKTSAVCGMCKKKIEKTMAAEKGVNSSTLDVESKVLTVSYNPKNTSEDKIRKTVNDTGYDADDKPATPQAFEKLSSCCRKDSKMKH